MRQGDVLAPTLFNLFLEAVLAKLFEGHVEDGVRIFYHPDAKLHVLGTRKRMASET